MPNFSDYVIFADESGDHSLEHVDKIYPVFVLCLCIVRKRHYNERILPQIQKLKFDWFGHDAIILHERDIRKKNSPFNILNKAEIFARFMSDLNAILSAARITVIASVIDKRRLKDEYLIHANPYHLALGFCIESTFRFLKSRRQDDKITHFLFERRGRKEDSDLESEFRRIVSGNNSQRRDLSSFEIVFVDKKANSAGMQLADLIARPIGMQIIRPRQSNRAFQIIAKKLGRKGIAAVKRYP